MLAKMVVGLLAAAISGFSALAQPAQWDLTVLDQSPQVYVSGYPETNGVRSIFFDGEPYKGKPTRVFAYLAVPEVAPGTKVPGIVLVHGGLGSAFRRWAKYWCEHGYAAISMDTCGCVSGNEFGNEQGAHRRHEWAGPAGWGKYEQVDEPVREQWMYHAIAAAIRGNSLLRSLTEVDPNRIGITGISWGGVITCIAGSVDHRFAFAAPVYGCGDYYDDSSMVRKLKDGPVWPKLKRWAEVFDPCNYLAEAKCPFLWIDGSNDFAFPLPALQKSVDLLKTPHYRAMRVRMPHAHAPYAEHPKELVDFAAFMLRPGARKSYPRVTASHLDAGTVNAACDVGEDKIVKAELNYTADLGFWEKREWRGVAMTLSANGTKASANLPKDAVAWYVNFFTADGKCVSGEFFRESDDTAAIQSRIDAAWKRGGGEVIVEPGEHRVRPLRLRSNVTLRLKAGAKLLASRNCGDYLATLAEDPLEPVSDATLKEVRGEDLTRRSQYALFRAYGVKNVRVVGEPGSVVDGGNCYDAKGAEGYRGPHTFWATCSTNVAFEGVTVVDSACYAFKTFRCRGVRVENVEIRGGHDGVHFDCCDDVRIANSRILTGDDSVAGSGCTDILVTNCVLSSSCSPFRLGGRNVLVTDCRVYGPAPCPHRWTLTAEEKERGLGPSEVGGRRNTGAFYQGYTGDKAHEGFQPGNIVVRNVTVDTVERFMVSLSGIPGAVWQDGAGIADITFENVKATGLGAPSVVVAKADRPLRLTLRNCSFAFRNHVGSAFLGDNIQVVDEGVTLKNAERLTQVRPDVSYDDIPEFPSWRIESDAQRAKWGLPPLKVSSAAGTAAALDAPIVLEGEYPGHLQDVWMSGNTIWWAHTQYLVKTDRRGRILATAKVGGHHAGLEVKDGHLYTAVCAFNGEPRGATTPQCHVMVGEYDAVTLERIKMHVLDINDRAGSLCILADGTYLIGCLRHPSLKPSEVKFHHVGADFKLIKTHVVDVGKPVKMGIETIRRYGDEVYLFIYEGPVMKLDAKDFSVRGRYKNFGGQMGFVRESDAAWIGCSRYADKNMWKSSLVRKPIVWRSFDE